MYPYENAFKICEDYEWKFIYVLQDSSLKTVQQELTLTRRKQPEATYYTAEHGWHITQEYRYQADIEYHKKYKLNWLQCIETRINRNKRKANTPPPIPETVCFEYVTNIKFDNDKDKEKERDNARSIGAAGRLRWKIENEGFNTQKNGDYELEHKYNRSSYNGLKNYYNLLQIAHAINQLIEKGKNVTAFLKTRPKETLHNLWSKLKGYMIFCKPDQIFMTEDTRRLIQPAPS